ncbi:MAG: tRNA epoxyqueuosine(34) reductase QueG [Bacteroidaceae bacterium]|nr:tRNA epoxyqueuosine(34) reductase QueG [Bacteroidaceae bacterium]
MNSAPLNSKELKAQAHRLGFVACGLAPAEPVQQWYARRFRQWLQLGYQADMQYMQNHVEMRLQPTLLHPGVRSIISLALNYMPSRQQPGISLYAQGRDYHDVMRERLRQLMAEAGLQGRCFVDTAPVLERYWAWRCGIGQFCRNGLIAVPGYGPTVFLGEIFVEQESDAYDQPLAPPPHDFAGWQSLCPALTPQGLDARLCISYQTIENRGELPQDLHLHRTFYGCDRCLRACPQFGESQPTQDEAFQPSPQLLGMQENDWRTLTPEQYKALFKDSAVKRAKYQGLVRNIQNWKP